LDANEVNDAPLLPTTDGSELDSKEVSNADDDVADVRGDDDDDSVLPISFTATLLLP
jgi:hypothetical protein